MNQQKQRLGRVFISHSSVDKPFVRRLATRLTKEGYRTWLDEHAMVPGDPLAATISSALANSRVVLVVVSAASIKSRWLKFELNKATERMVDGKCRVIPVVREKVELPPEVQGLLYADFSEEFRFGMRGVLTALEHEVALFPQEKPFWQQVDNIVDEVFGGRCHASSGGEYQSLDYETVTISVPFGDDDSVEVVYEAVPAFWTPGNPLSDQWWSEYGHARNQYGEMCYYFFLLVTERPVQFQIERRSPVSPKIGVNSSRLLLPGNMGTALMWCTVIVDLSDVQEHAQRQDLIAKAYQFLKDLIRENNQPTAAGPAEQRLPPSAA